MKTTLVGFVAALTTATALGEAPLGGTGFPERVGIPLRTTHFAHSGWWPYGHRGASTPAESYASGAAALIRAQGSYNLLTSQATVNATEARRYALENSVRATEAYFKRRELNQEYRARMRGPRATPEDLKRYAEAGKPPRLSPSEMDQVNGEITWPRILRTDRYAGYRFRLEALFAKRAGPDELSAASYFQIDRTTKAMLGELKNQVAVVPQMEYIAAKRFIQSLAYEARRPTS